MLLILLLCLQFKLNPVFSTAERRSILHVVLPLCVFYLQYEEEYNSVIALTKGQIISEQKCGVLNFPKMQ